MQEIKIVIPDGNAPLLHIEGKFQTSAFVELDTKKMILRAGFEKSLSKTPSENEGKYAFYSTHIKREALLRLMTEKMLPLAERMIRGDQNARNAFRMVCNRPYPRDSFSMSVTCSDTVRYLKIDRDTWLEHITLRDMSFRLCYDVFCDDKILCEPYFSAWETEVNKYFFMENALLNRLFQALRDGELHKEDLHVMQRIALQVHQPSVYGSLFWGENNWDVNYEPLTCKEFYPFIARTLWEYGCGPYLSDPFANETRRALERAAEMKIRLVDPENLFETMLLTTCENMENEIRSGQPFESLCAQLPDGVFETLEEKYPEQVAALKALSEDEKEPEQDDMTCSSMS